MNNSNKFIPLASPDINDSDIAEVTRILKSGMLIQGPEVERLEESIASFIGVKHCIAVSNGTATMHLSLLALGVGEGDEVIVPGFSYVATANVVELVGAKPVFVDIDLATFNIDTNKIEQAITSKTKAIITVHEFGLASDIRVINAIAAKHKLYLIEDAACALGAKENDQYVGSFGIAGSFSLHPRKAISSGEGGLISTNDDKLATQLRILRNHGVQYINGKMDFVAAAYNYRMTDFQAALVHSQFTRFDKIISYKQKLAEMYFNEIKNPLFTLPTVPATKKHSWQTFHVILNDQLDQTDIINKLKESGIGTNYGAQCIPFQTYYQNKYQLDCEKLYPHALQAYKKGLAIPLYQKMSKDDIKRVADAINKIKI